MIPKFGVEKCLKYDSKKWLIFRGRRMLKQRRKSFSVYKVKRD